MTKFDTEDLRFAVAAGIIDEARAAALTAFVQQRQGVRDAMPAEDEPFEFFRGFSEIFITVGLAILVAGMLGFAVVIGGDTLMPIAGVALSWGLSLYLIRRRRMTLPGIFMCASFGTFIATALVGLHEDIHPLIVSATGMAGLGLYFRVFRLPFAMFVFGLYGALGVLALLGGFSTLGGFAAELFDDGFDLRSGSSIAWGSLIAGIIAFVGGMYFDLRDPMRVSRHSATGFWLHMLAAPAMVNTIALSLLQSEGDISYLYTALALVAIAVLALVIDRRSFLIAGIGYLGAILIWALESRFDDATGGVLSLMLLGAFISALGIWWVGIRATLMRCLPDFPGKGRLPPWRSPDDGSSV